MDAGLVLLWCLSNIFHVWTKHFPHDSLQQPRVLAQRLSANRFGSSQCLPKVSGCKFAIPSRNWSSLCTIALRSSKILDPLLVKLSCSILLPLRSCLRSKWRRLFLQLCGGPRRLYVLDLPRRCCSPRWWWTYQTRPRRIGPTCRWGPTRLPRGPRRSRWLLPCSRFRPAPCRDAELSPGPKVERSDWGRLKNKNRIRKGWLRAGAMLNVLLQPTVPARQIDVYSSRYKTGNHIIMILWLEKSTYCSSNLKWLLSLLNVCGPWL